MRKRLVLSAAALSAIALSVPAALAGGGAATLDGKSTKTLTLKATATAQDHDSDFVTGSAGLDPARVDCTAPRCASLPFVYKPARGVKGDIAFSLSWTIPASDFDLYVAEIGKDGNSEVAACGASAGTSEKVFLDASNFKAGKTYALIADFYRTPGEAITGTITMPGSNSVATTAPSTVDDLQKINCGL
jgi:hypothetical protein